jgi:predicted  nucleic acid-binding Zn-ribbon protein
MTTEPENLTLELLRGIRADVSRLRDGLTSVREGLSEVRDEVREVREDIRGLRRVQDNHSLRFDYLEEVVGTLRDSTMMALGHSVDAVERKKKMETRITELAERVEKLEKAK